MAKKIPLKVHPAATPEMIADNKAANTKNIISLILNYQDPQAGIALNIDDIDKRLRIKKAINEIAEGSTVLQLEDADHAELKKILPLVRGLPVDEFYSEVFHDIRNA